MNKLMLNELTVGHLPIEPVECRDGADKESRFSLFKFHLQTGTFCLVRDMLIKTGTVESEYKHDGGVEKLEVTEVWQDLQDSSFWWIKARLK